MTKYIAYVVSFVAISINAYAIEIEYEEIISSTRLKQSIRDTPASITIIKQKDLHELGVTSIAEAMRLVPGMSVIKASGNDYRIEYHGTNALVPRRMQILIDGMSWYRVGYAQIDWETLPVSISEIDRIEVTRSPNTATYGANSYSAIINIITSNPRDQKKLSLYSSVGTQNNINTQAVTSGDIGRTSYSITAQQKKNSGYDTNASTDMNRIDSTTVKRISIRSNTNIDKNMTIEVSGGLSFSKMENEFGDVDQISSPTVTRDDKYFQTNITKFWGKNKIKINAYYTNTKGYRDWETCKLGVLLLPESKNMFDNNPDYLYTILGGGMPAGGTNKDDELAAALLSEISRLSPKIMNKYCAEISEDVDESRYDIDANITRVIAKSARILAGLNYRFDKINSQTFFNAEVTKK